MQFRNQNLFPCSHEQLLSFVSQKFVVSTIVHYWTRGSVLLYISRILSYNETKPPNNYGRNEGFAVMESLPLPCVWNNCENQEQVSSQDPEPVYCISLLNRCSPPVCYSFIATGVIGRYMHTFESTMSQEHFSRKRSFNKRQFKAYPTIAARLRKLQVVKS